MAVDEHEKQVKMYIKHKKRAKVWFELTPCNVAKKLQINNEIYNI